MTSSINMKNSEQTFENFSNFNSNVIIDRRNHRLFIRQTTIRNDDSKFSHEQNSLETSIQFQAIQFIRSSKHSSNRRSNSLFDEFTILQNTMSMHTQFFQSSFDQFKRIDQFVFINQFINQSDYIQQVTSLKQSIEIRFIKQKQRLIVLKQTSAKMKNKLNDFNDSLKSLIKNFKHRSSKNISFVFEN